MKIQVTQDDINHGERESAIACPIALAVARATNEPCEIELDYIHVCGFEIDTPESVQDFIELFDEGEEVQPFEFEIEDYDES